MKAVVLALAFLVLAGCAANGPSLGAIQNECGYNIRPFEQSWPCVRVGFANGGRTYADLRQYYVSVGDVAAERVAAGQITQAEAKLTMEQAKQHIIQAGLAREARAGVQCIRAGYSVICD
jgi:hypothetical protein